MTSLFSDAAYPCLIRMERCTSRVACVSPRPHGYTAHYVDTWALIETTLGVLPDFRGVHLSEAPAEESENG